MEPDSVQAIWNQGLAHHQAGRLEEAWGRYAAALAIDDRHFDSLHMLGVLCIQTGQLERGAELIGQAIAINPGVAAAYGNLGNAFNGLKRFEQAIISSDRAIALNPDYPEAHGNRGLALYQLNRPQEGLASYDRLVALKPADARAHHSRGIMLRALGRPHDALASFARAVELKPDHAEAHYDQALVLRELGQPHDALAGYDRVIALRPDYPEAHNNRGNVLGDLKRYDEALVSYEQAIALKPDYAEAYSNQTIALRQLRRPEEALASCDAAIALQPDYAEAHLNRAGALYDFRRLDEVLQSFERALALKPDYAEAWCNRGVTLYELRRFAEAHASLERAAALNPHDAETRYYLAQSRLMQGDYAQGWADYESRWRTRQFADMARGLEAPLWRGEEDISGCTLLIHAEQGLGDTLQFCRYSPRLAALGARVVLEVQPGLERLMTRLDGVDEIVTRGAPLPPHDAQIPMMSLPLALGAGPDGERVPYLSADPALAAGWASRMGSTGKRRVGLCWAGGTRPDQSIAHAMDLRRSLPLDALIPFADLSSVEFYSLQKGPPAAELTRAQAQGWAGPPITDWTADLNDFADTAALAVNLDLMITCDTSTAHLAGGLGIPVWVLSRFDGCWRWLDGRDDSPWYPSARLFRQPEVGDWASVIAAVRTELLSLTR